ncbi:MAG: PqqD family protein [Candidatus Marinimicrobia bacterium]|nr:PqqD family protein [Candidatus Neomarinimicrobiota bacterium]
MSGIFNSEVTISDSGFLFDHGTGLTYSLNETGQFIFTKMKEEVHANKMLELIMEEFDINEETARKDIDDFYRQLKEAGLID